MRQATPAAIAPTATGLAAARSLMSATLPRLRFTRIYWD
jgi:hypothetical protein